MKPPSGGAECRPGGGVDFRVWAPGHQLVELLFEHTDKPYGLRAEEDGYFSAHVEHVGPGTLYRYRIDGHGPYPDPISRFQPAGPDGPSEVVDPTGFAWTDEAWRGLVLRGQVFYELHVGTFTTQGTLSAAQAKLPYLRDLGVTTIELLPLADFAGDFGWGYDGVNLYAPQHHYGRPDAVRSFVDAAHALGLGVILDVVYNHLGSSGNYMAAFSPYYLSARGTEWGAGLNFDADRAGPVRQWVCENAAYWIREFHFDGFRIDATQSVFDSSKVHILSELTERARAVAASMGRTIVMVAENEPQRSMLLHPAELGGYGLDGMWNDDFHHSAVVALTGKREAYYKDYAGRAQELVAAAKHGFLFQGQYYSWQKQRRGSSTRGLAPHRFIAYLENHDQVANTPSGDRLCQATHPGEHRAMTALLLLGPWTPLLFQGQEWLSARPFPYFAQHPPELAAQMLQGRKQSLSQFPSLASRAVRDALPDPSALSTFEGAKLQWTGDFESLRGQRSRCMYRDLLHMRHDDAVLRPCADAVEIDSVALSDTILLLRCYSPDDHDRLLLVNFGADLALTSAAEPLLAPPAGHAFHVLWSSEDLRYGGLGQPDGVTDAEGYNAPGRAAVLFEAVSSPALRDL